MNIYYDSVVYVGLPWERLGSLIPRGIVKLQQLIY